MGRLPCADDLVYFDNGIVFAKWSTVSNVAYVLLGMIGMYQTHQSTLHAQRRTAERAATSSPVLRPQMAMILYAWILMIGIVSTVYHSTLQPWSLSMDFFAIEVYCLLVLWNLCLNKFSPLVFWGTSIVVVGTTFLLKVSAVADTSWRSMSSVVYNGMVSILMMTIFLVTWDRYLTFRRRVQQPMDRWATKYVHPHQLTAWKKSRFYLLVSCIGFGLALVCFILPKVYCPVRRGDYPWFQMHSYWHLLSATSLYCLVQTLSCIQQ